MVLIKHGLLCLLLVVCFACTPTTNNNQNTNDWTTPFPAFRIAGNLYYVGTKGVASYLITTPEGHILINSNLEALASFYATRPPALRTVYRPSPTLADPRRLDQAGASARVLILSS